MPSLSTLPVYAPPGIETQAFFALTAPTANYVRVWVTDAPPGSSLRAKLDKSTQHRVEVYTGAGGDDHPWRTKFDVGGKYSLVAQEYTRGASRYGGGYQGSPDGDPSETKVGSETTLALYIGQRLTSAISVGQDTVELALWVWDSTIRETSLAVHGEASPALAAKSETPRARAVTESAAVQTALLALRDQVVATATGTVGTVLSDIVAKWNGHLVQASVHASNDTLNAIPRGLSGAASAANLGDSLQEILPLFRNHYTNDAVKGGTVAGRDTDDTHAPGGNKANDNVNLPIVQGASGLADGYWGVAELARSYELHRVSSVHSNPDSTNALAGLPLLMQLGVAVLSVFASTSPTTPTTQSTGAMTLIARAGFEEAPL